jgi:hypothetical protein
MNDYAVSNAFYDHLRQRREDDALQMIKEYGIRPVYSTHKPIYEAVFHDCLRVVRVFLEIDPSCVGAQSQLWASILFAVRTVEMAKLLAPYREFIDCKKTNGYDRTAAEDVYWYNDVCLQLMASFPALPLARVYQIDKIWHMYLRMAMVQCISTDMVRHFF